MKKLNLRKLFVPGIYLIAVISVIGCIVLTGVGINNYLTEKKDFTYSVKGLLDSGSVPVNKEENSDTTTTTQDTIIRPYKATDVTIGRYFYDFEADQKKQEDSIIFYENTYMQNSGVDYISENQFEVLSVLPGKVISVEKDDILGNIVKIEHEKEIISVYQGIDKLTLKEGDSVTQGQVIGASGTSSINANYKTSLHFEVYYKGSLIDPENFYSLKLSDL